MAAVKLPECWHRLTLRKLPQMLTLMRSASVRKWVGHSQAWRMVCNPPAAVKHLQGKRCKHSGLRSKTHVKNVSARMQTDFLHVFPCMLQ